MKLQMICTGLWVVLTCILCGATAKAEPFTNSLGMTLVRVDAGHFRMGSTGGGDWDEQPEHEVTITQPYFIAATEVTNAQYEQFDPDHRALRGKHGFSKEDDEAVVFVSWHEAVRFCEWLSKKEGKPYRLPTEAEWEYACRAGTTTPFSTGERLPEAFLKHPQSERSLVPVSLRVAGGLPNSWGLYDMHGNVEEWCYDWYGPYGEEDQTDPVGYAEGDFKVARGGSHNTEVRYLRSANRSSTLPEDKHALIGFRVVSGEPPSTAPRPKPAPPLWAQNILQERHEWNGNPDPGKPFLAGPIRYVHLPPNSDGPMFSRHNHCPALTACPNGDLLAIWYSTNTEPGRELAIVAARLRKGQQEWDPASPFWDAADRNDHASALLWDGQDTLYHFNGLCSDATWGKLALILRISTDNGATWSKARLINAEHGLQNMPIAGVFMTAAGEIVLPCDAVTGGKGGSVVHVSPDRGQIWVAPPTGDGLKALEEGASGPLIAGIHAGVVHLGGARLMALGRGDAIDNRMPMSVSPDMGRTWTYSASPFSPIGGGQRLILKRLKEGPILFISFTPKQGIPVKDASGQERQVYGMFSALSTDDGQTWSFLKPVTPGGLSRQLDGGGNTGHFRVDDTHAEPAGYLALIQTPDGVIHLISSALYYQFNLAWLQEPMPVPAG